MTIWTNRRKIDIIKVSCYLDHLMDIALWPCELRRILDFDEDDEVQIMPHVVLRSDVLLKRHILVVESLKRFSFDEGCRHQETNKPFVPDRK